MLSGDFQSDEEGTYLVSKRGRKLRISNMATGSKMVALLTMLLREGTITRDTMLIFDEPESHLHPEWQNTFAEIIVLLVSELQAKVLMTTHSPNFFYALDTYSKKYKIADRCAFYQSECSSDGHAVINDVSADTGKIYSDFLDYLVEMRNIRQELDGDEEDIDAHERDIRDNEVDDTRKTLHNLNRRRKSKWEYMYDQVDVMAAGRFEEEYCKC